MSRAMDFRDRFNRKEAPRVRKPAVIFPLRERMMIVNAHEAVNVVVPLWESPPREFILAARPTVHCKGGDRKHLPEAEVIASVGGVVRMLPRCEGFEISSSTDLKRRILRCGGFGPASIDTTHHLWYT